MATNFNNQMDSQVVKSRDFSDNYTTSPYGSYVRISPTLPPELRGPVEAALDNLWETEAGREIIIGAYEQEGMQINITHNAQSGTGAYYGTFGDSININHDVLNMRYLGTDGAMHDVSAERLLGHELRHIYFGHDGDPATREQKEHDVIASNNDHMEEDFGEVPRYSHSNVDLAGTPGLEIAGEDAGPGIPVFDVVDAKPDIPVFTMHDGDVSDIGGIRDGNAAFTEVHGSVGQSFSKMDAGEREMIKQPGGADNIYSFEEKVDVKGGQSVTKIDKDGRLTIKGQEATKHFEEASADQVSPFSKMDRQAGIDRAPAQQYEI